MDEEKSPKDEILDAILDDKSPEKKAHESIGEEEHFCPNCQEWYEPKYDSKGEAKRNNDSTGAEQYITGICSDKCWNEYLSVSEKENWDKHLSEP